MSTDVLSSSDDTTHKGKKSYYLILLLIVILGVGFAIYYLQVRGTSNGTNADADNKNTAAGYQAEGAITDDDFCITPGGKVIAPELFARVNQFVEKYNKQEFDEIYDGSYDFKNEPGSEDGTLFNSIFSKENEEVGLFANRMYENLGELTKCIKIGYSSLESNNIWDGANTQEVRLWIYPKKDPSKEYQMNVTFMETGPNRKIVQIYISNNQEYY